MPYLPTADEWLRLSAQLLEARPTTTRVSTRYSISPARLRKVKTTTSQDATNSNTTADVAMPDAPTSASTSKPPRAKLIIKTYDPHSGVCLKYKTAKAQEVGRLVQMLGSLGRNMAALSAALPVAVDEELGGAAGMATPPVAGGVAQQSAAAGGAPATGGDGGKGKKKKKGKR